MRELKQTRKITNDKREKQLLFIMKKNLQFTNETTKTYRAVWFSAKQINCFSAQGHKARCQDFNKEKQRNPLKRAVLEKSLGQTWLVLKQRAAGREDYSELQKLMNRGVSSPSPSNLCVDGELKPTSQIYRSEVKRKHSTFIFLPLYLGINIETMLKNWDWRLETAGLTLFFFKWTPISRMQEAKTILQHLFLFFANQ